MSPGKRSHNDGNPQDDHHHHHHHQQQGQRRRKGDDDDLVPPRKITGKELTEIEELSARLTALVEILDEKGIINIKEFNRIVAMRLHEISKAAAIEELDEDL
jgi:predicted transcriptional regulator YheO